MSSGYYLTPAFYYFNLGAHTLYILRNRLQAQKVKKSKQIKILQDICQAIFKQNFIQSLLVPQDPFSVATLKDIFSRLVHSSIMKLDQSSMDKLFYLILMSVKKELFLLSSPYQLFTVTLSHLLNLVKYLEDTNAVQNLSYVIQQFQKVCSTYTYIQYLQIRQYMLSELQTYQTKIVNFIQNENQTSNGKLIFRLRNEHNQKSLGSANNQNDIQQLASNLLQNPKPESQLFYNDWQVWRTSLVVDFVKQYKIASDKRNSSTLTKNQQTIHKQNKQKTLKDTLKINNCDLNQFEVTFDLFQKDKDQLQQNNDLIQSLQNSKKTVQVKKYVPKANNTFKNKIQNEFSEIKLQQIDKEDQQPDLLQMMDS